MSRKLVVVPIVVAGASLTALLPPGAAAGAVGDLTPSGCVDDHSVGQGPDDCAQSAAGLNGVGDVAVSPDGRSVYAVAQAGGENSIVRFDREPVTGSLTPRGCIEDDEVGSDSCAQETDGLFGAASVALSADGKSVYVASLGDDAIVRFDRDTSGPDIGTLTPQGCVDDDDFGTDPSQGPDTCSQSTDGLAGAQSVAVSPDGTSVYAASFEDDALVRLARDPVTGALTAIDAGCVEDDDTGPDDCGAVAEGLANARSVILSPDGASLYSASPVDDAIARFERDTLTGELTPAGCVEDDDPPDGPDGCAQDTDGLAGVGELAITSDGRSLYATGQADNAIVHLSREVATGALDPRGCVEDNDVGPDDCASSADGLASALGVAVSADRRSVYVSSVSDNAVAHLVRNTTTGALAPQGCVEDDDVGPDACAQRTDGLEGATAVAVAGDDSSVYATGGNDDAVVFLDRDRGDSPATPVTVPPAAVGGSAAGENADCPRIREKLRKAKRKLRKAKRHDKPTKKKRRKVRRLRRQLDRLGCER